MRENPILGAIRDVGDDIARLHRWLTEIDSDNEHYWGEGSWDFTPDWSGSVARGAIARLFRRIFRLVPWDDEALTPADEESIRRGMADAAAGRLHTWEDWEELHKAGLECFGYANGKDGPHRHDSTNR
jgi:predicted transcriptional regulator